MSIIFPESRAFEFARASSHRGRPFIPLPSARTRVIPFYTCFSVRKSVNPAPSAVKNSHVHIHTPIGPRGSEKWPRKGYEYIICEGARAQHTGRLFWTLALIYLLRAFRTFVFPHTTVADTSEQATVYVLFGVYTTFWSRRYSEKTGILILVDTVGIKTKRGGIKVFRMTNDGRSSRNRRGPCNTI